MESIDKWLKSLRLHKYAYLFKSLTYDEMLNLDESFLLQRNVTKGARNKMLVSIKKLNLRKERLMSMTEDLENQDISLKEALTVLKDILITPIPAPQYTYSIFNYKLYDYEDPYQLTHLFIDTLEQVARKLVDPTNAACGAMLSSIIDECLRHDSFSDGQKARVVGLKRNISKQKLRPLCSNLPQNSGYPHISYRHTHNNHVAYRPYHKEYSLLEPRTTFELPCLRALVGRQNKADLHRGNS